MPGPGRLDDRGVSETVGFVLVFALIVSTVGVVYTAGYASLQDVRDAERVNNAERAFDVFAENVEDIVRRGAPSRGTELALADASLGAGRVTYVNVTGYDSGGAVRFTSGNMTMDSLVYQADGTQIRYDAGAVIRRPVGSEAGVMLNEPSFVISHRHVILPLVQFNVPSGSVAGSTTVRIRTKRSVRRVLVSRTTPTDTLVVDISSPTNGVWAEYLEGQGMDCSYVADGGPETVRCTMDDVERVQIYWYLIDVSLE